MDGPRWLYLSWVLAVLVIVTMSFDGKADAPNFQGIADTREVVVNSESAVEIKQFHVLPGQVVRSGDLLVELNRPELLMKINEISHELEEVKSRHTMNAEEKKSRIRQLQAEEASKTSEIDYKIRQLRSRHDLNQELTTELPSLRQPENLPGKNTVHSPIALEIESLKKESELLRNRIKTEVTWFQAALSSPENALSIRAQSLEKELTLLRREQEELLIYSQINGVIGSVHFRAGEKASPFAPILTLYTKAPSYVRGFIHENLYNQVAVGEKVIVSSLAGKHTVMPGEVIGVGSRIVSYPERLKKRPEIQVWGREVQVRIPEENSFLLGEKVIIQSARSKEQSYWAKMKALWETRISDAADLKSDAPDIQSSPVTG